MKIFKTCKLGSLRMKFPAYLICVSLLFGGFSSQAFAQKASELDQTVIEDVRSTVDNHIRILQDEIDNGVPGIDVQVNQGIINYYQSAMRIWLSQDVNLNFAVASALGSVSSTSNFTPGGIDFFFTQSQQQMDDPSQYPAELLELNIFRSASPSVRSIIADIDVSSGSMASLSSLVNWIQANK